MRSANEYIFEIQEGSLNRLRLGFLLWQLSVEGSHEITDYYILWVYKIDKKIWAHNVLIIDDDNFVTINRAEIATINRALMFFIKENFKKRDF